MPTEKKKDPPVSAAADSSNFFVQLWDSVFTPGTTPALIFATHVSFVILIMVFVVLVIISRQPLRFHFTNMLIISIIFYGVVVWFINELKNTNTDETDEKNKANGETSEKEHAAKPVKKPADKQKTLSGDKDSKDKQD